MLSIAFLGAAGTVTGSKFLVRYGAHSFLVDCGLFQGMEEAEELNRRPLPLPPRSLSALVLTHAHTDHAGGVPGVVARGFQGPIFCTEPTRDFSQLLWLDSARLQQDRATALEPAMFDEEDAKDALEFVETRNYYEPFAVVPGVSATFLDAGHILGSAWVELEFQPLPEWPEQRPIRVVFSGDIGTGQAPMLAPPDRPQRADFLVLESTYGDRLHSGASARDQLAQAVATVRQKRSTLIIAGFAIQRCQDLAYLFEELAPEVASLPVFLDSPMACRAVEVFEEYPDYMRRAVGEALNRRGRLLRYPFLELCLTARQSRSIWDLLPPKVVISASGMCEGGRVLHHLRQHLPDPSSHLLLAGFQCPGTRGHALLQGAPQVEIDGFQVPVRCHIDSLDGLSGHADYAQLGRWLDDLNQAPQITFLVHGDESGLTAQQQRLRQERGWQVEVPRSGQEFVLMP